MKRKLATLSVACVGVLAFSGIAAGNAFALEFVPNGGAGVFPMTYTSASGAGALKSAAGEIKCKTDKDVGFLLNGTEGESTVRFQDCTTVIGGTEFACETNHGEILSESLLSYLIWLNKGHSKFGILLTAEPLSGPEGGLGGTLSEFSCASGLLKVKVTGAVIGQITSPALKTKSKEFTLNLATNGAGEQEFRQIEEAGTEYVPESEFNESGMKFPSTEATTDIATLPEKGEFIEGAETTLCKVEPENIGGTLYCPAGDGYSGEVKGEFVAGNELKLNFTGGTVTCNKLSLKGEYSENGQGTLDEASFSDNAAKADWCVTNRGTENEAKVEFPSLPKASWFEYQHAEVPVRHDGLMWWAADPALLPMVIAFESGEECEYELHSSYGLMSNGTPSTVRIGGAWHLIEGPGACPAELEQADAFTAVKGAGGVNVYIAKE